MKAEEMVRTRLDRALVDRGLAATRSRARDLIARGCVLVNGAPQTKAGLEIRETDEVSVVSGANSFVSRGGVKLSAALALHASTRDEPVNLTGSRLRTHQHWSPADATCCQSLLLDPNATMSIDLHKRLFLLVTGRGE